MARKSTIQDSSIPDALAEQAARVVIHKYALLPNCVKGCLAGSLRAPVRPGEKNWVSHFYGLSERKIVYGITSRSICFAASHSRFSRMIVFDVDKPERDEGLVQFVLQSLGWRYKVFHSGRGRHYWVFFTDLGWEALGRFRSGPTFLFSVGKYIMGNHLALAGSDIQVRGCSGALIKLPLQFDPHYEKLVLPYDDSGTLIADYASAIEFADRVEPNESSLLNPFIDLILRERREARDRRRDPARRDTAEFDDWLASVTVGEGESNSFILDLVFHAYHAGVREEEIPAIVEDLYRSGSASGRITCKDTVHQWLSKARSRAAWLYSAAPTKAVRFTRGDIAWVVDRARMSRSPHAFHFLSLHLWASKQHDHDDYFLSRPYAAEFGIPESAYQRCVERFHPDVIRIVRHGTRYPSGGHATTYRLVDPPQGAAAGEYLISPAEFARLCIECQYMVHL